MGKILGVDCASSRENGSRDVIIEVFRSDIASLGKLSVSGLCSLPKFSDRQGTVEVYFIYMPSQ